MPAPASRRRQLATGAAVVAGYLVISMVCWLHLVHAGVGSHLHTLQLGDPGQGVFFMGWLPYALGHGLNPFHSAYMFAPKGVNMLSNTSFFLEALLFAPVTELWNPLASFNLACILAPVVSGTAMYWALRRLGISAPTGFVAGAAYGFAPAILQGVVVGHFNLTWMFFPPLLVVALERICFRQVGSPARYGIWLGVLVVLEFFNSLEILLDCAAVSEIVIAVVAAVRWREVAARLRFALPALGIAVLLSGCVLAYPIACYFGGAEHVTALASSAHPGAALTSLLWPSQPVGKGLLVAPAGTPLFRRFDEAFVGPVLLVGALASLAFAGRRRISAVVLAGALVSFVLSLGGSLRISPEARPTSWHLPAWWLAKAVPLFRNVDWIRLSVLTDSLLVIAAAIAADEALSALSRREVPATARLAALGTAGVLAVGPMLVASEVPFGVFTAVSAPKVLTEIPQVGGQPPIAVVYPPGDVFDGPPLAWQALAGFSWRSWSGYAWHPSARSGGRPTVNVAPSVVQYLTALAPVLPHEHLTPSHRRQVLGSLQHLGIQTVVIVDGYSGSAKLAWWMDQVLGPARHEGGGSLWSVPAPHSGTA